MSGGEVERLFRGKRGGIDVLGVFVTNGSKNACRFLQPSSLVQIISPLLLSFSITINLFKERADKFTNT